MRINDPRSLRQLESSLCVPVQVLEKQQFLLAVSRGALYLKLPTSIALSQLPLLAKPPQRCEHDFLNLISMDDPQSAPFTQ
jgi:hypothetical protein